MTTTLEGNTAMQENADNRRIDIWFADMVRKAQREPISFVIQLTPALAKFLMVRNPGNRILKKGKLENYVSDIQANRWSLNGEPIIISMEGLLNNGQHRCTAVIRANRAIKTMIVFGVDRESRMTLDQGANRLPGDYLSMEGVPCANNAAAVAALVWQYININELSHEARKKPTKAEVRATYHATPEIQDSIKFVNKSGVGLIGGTSLIAFCHLILSRVDRDDAEFFIKKLMVGDNLAASDPIFICRQRLISTNKRDRLLIGEKAELIFRAWVGHRVRPKVTKVSVLGALPDVAVI